MGKYIAYIIGIAMVLTIIFVRAGEKGGESGGSQTSKIFTSGASGLSSVIRASTGA